jgi:hypothetical protein
MYGSNVDYHAPTAVRRLHATIEIRPLRLEG